MLKLFRKEWRLSIKLFTGFTLLWVLPIVLMLFLSTRHLANIQDVAVEGTRVVLIATQTRYLKDRLAQEANRLSGLFTRIQDETYTLGSFTKTILQSPSQPAFRNGSHYVLSGNGIYGNRASDGNSALFVLSHRPDKNPVITATEAMDLLLKPLAERESTMVLAWMVHRDGITRAYPWRDFARMPRDKELTSWPFYYLADANHDPLKKVIFTPVYLDPLSREWMISCLYPVYAAGRHDATVGVDITIHNLLREISEMRLTAGSSSLLFSGEEIIAASPNLPLAALGLDPKLPPHGQKLANSTFPRVRELAEHVRSSKEDIQGIELPGIHAFVGHATIKPLDWKLVFFVPEDEVIGPAYESARKILSETKDIRLNFLHILIFSLVGVVVIVVTAIIYQSRGLRTLLKGIRELGDGNLSHRVPEEGTEFGQLAKALNTTAQNLQEKKDELQRIFAEVEQGRKLTAVGRLAAGVAHEVNNPLATISTYTQMVLRRTDMPTGIHENMTVVMAEIKRIQAQLRNLLDLSRLESPVKTEIHTNSIIKEIAELVSYETTTRGIDLRLSLCDGSPTVFADGSGIKQIIWNLLRNALDAQEKGGTISLSTYMASSEIPSFVIDVEDEGPGIPSSSLNHIFEPFFSTKEVGSGTGLGLSIVYNIVKNHGGTIEVLNLTPKGCLFRVTFPAMGA